MSKLSVLSKEIEEKMLIVNEAKEVMENQCDKYYCMKIGKKAWANYDPVELIRAEEDYARKKLQLVGAKRRYLREWRKTRKDNKPCQDIKLGI
jgi:hypothetical protein